MKQTDGKYCKNRKQQADKILLIIGWCLIFMELWKQCYLYFIYFDRHYDVWHVLLIVISMLVFRYRLADNSRRGFVKSFRVFLPMTAFAEMLNVVLHVFGDCDMFYISPYHLSSQPVLRQMDAVIGRIPGILVYIGVMIFGAYLVHLLFVTIKK